MPDDNRISAEITPEQKTAVLDHIKAAMDGLDFLVNLTPEEKRRIPTIGTERSAMDEAFSKDMEAQPNLVPGYVKTDELARDRQLRADLLEILQQARKLSDALEDTLHVAGGDILTAYLGFYSNVQEAAKRNVSGAGTVLENLKRFFPRGRRSGSESSGDA